MGPVGALWHMGLSKKNAMDVRDKAAVSTAWSCLMCETIRQGSADSCPRGSVDSLGLQVPSDSQGL